MRKFSCINFLGSKQICVQSSKSGDHNIWKLAALKPQSISHEILSMGAKEPNVYLKLLIKPARIFNYI